MASILHALWAQHVVRDVVVYYKDGLFHLLYLFDRNHHGKPWDAEPHIFHHMTTRDLVNWVDHMDPGVDRAVAISRHRHNGLVRREIAFRVWLAYDSYG